MVCKTPLSHTRTLRILRDYKCLSLRSSLEGNLDRVPYDFKTFLEACYREKILLELGSQEAQLIIAEFKSNLCKYTWQPRRRILSSV